MIKIALWNSERTSRIISNLYEIGLKTEFIIVRDKNVSFEQVDNVKIISSFDAFNFYYSEYDYLIIPTILGNDISCEEVKREIINYDFVAENIKWIPIDMLKGVKKYDWNNFIDFDEYSYLDYLEYKLCDHCNLRCKGCSHFSNIVDEPVFRDFNKFIRDIKQLKKHINHIYKIRILGGEPFLHPQMYEFLEVFREIYPHSDIRVCTNGTMLSKLSNNDFEMLRKNQIGVDISVYPQFINDIGQIETRFMKEGIFLNIEAHNFFYPVLLEVKNTAPCVELCDCNDTNLYDGKLAPCPLMLTIDYFNNKFNKSYPNNNHLIDIYDDKLTGKNILMELKKTRPLCSFCANYRKDIPGFKWQRDMGKFDSDDWIYKYVSEGD